MKRIYAANEEQWREICGKSWYRDKTLRVDEVGKGIVLPSVSLDGTGKYSGGVCTENFDFVAGLLRSSDDPSIRPGQYGINTPYRIPGDKLQFVDEEVIFGGVLVGHFGHFILECMARFWYLLEHPEDQRRIVFTTVLGQKNWFWNFFDLLGLKRERILFVEQPTQYSRVIVPEEAVHSWGFYTNAYRLPYQRLMQICGQGDESKIYLTRTAFYKKGTCIYYNEEYFEHFFRDKGFKIVAPEQLPIKEQIRLMAGAEEVVTTIGSLAHFANFCRKNTQFTMLARVASQAIPAQGLVLEASGVNWKIVDVSANLLHADRTYGPILLGPTRYWQEYVLDRYGEKIDDTISLKDSCWEYLYQWAEFYSNQKQFEKIRDKNAYDFLNILYRTTHGKPLPFPNPLEPPPLSSEIAIQKEREKIAERIRSRNTLKFFQQLLGDTDDVFARAEEERPLLQADIHVSNEGWINGLYETEEWQGVKDPNHHIEALRCRFTDTTDWRVSYRVRDKAGFWSSWVANGEMSGTTGKNAPLTGIAFRFDNGPAQRYSVRYRIRSAQSTDGWSTWTGDGTDCLVDAGLDIGGIQVELVNRTVKKLPHSDYFPDELEVGSLQMALGLTSPWKVESHEFSPEKRRLDIRLGFAEGSVFVCPKCGQTGLKAYNTDEKLWRYLNFFQYETWLSAKVPRVKCVKCGVKQVSIGVGEKENLIKNFLFSFIIPCWNGGKCIPEAMESMFAQTIGFEENIQIILVNDGSTDNTDVVCKRYRELWPNNIVLIDLPGNNTDAARNVGLQAATGRYINFLDPANKWDTDACEAALDFFGQHPEIHVACFPIILSGENKDAHWLNYKFTKTRVANILKEPDSAVLDLCSCFCAQEAVKNRSFDEDLPISDESAWIAKLLLDEQNFALFAKPYCYCRFPQSSAVEAVQAPPPCYADTLRPDLDILRHAKERYGEMPEWAQYTVMLNLCRRLREKDRGILTPSQKEKYRELMRNCLEQIDDRIICTVRNPWLEERLFALALKHGRTYEQIKEWVKPNAKEKSLSFCRPGTVPIPFAKQWKLWLEFMNIADEQLQLRGSCAVLVAPSERMRLVLTVASPEDGIQEYPCELFRRSNLQRRRLAFGEDFWPREGFELALALPLAATAEIRAFAEIDGLRFDMKWLYKQRSPFVRSGEQPYWEHANYTISPLTDRAGLLVEAR